MTKAQIEAEIENDDSEIFWESFWDLLEDPVEDDEAWEERDCRERIMRGSLLKN